MDCAAPSPYCEPSTGTCAECRFDTHCPEGICEAQAFVFLRRSKRFVVLGTDFVDVGVVKTLKRSQQSLGHLNKTLLLRDRPVMRRTMGKPPDDVRPPRRAEFDVFHSFSLS